MVESCHFVWVFDLDNTNKQQNLSSLILFANQVLLLRVTQLTLVYGDRKLQVDLVLEHAPHGFLLPHIFLVYTNTIETLYKKMKLGASGDLRRD